MMNSVRKRSNRAVMAGLLAFSLLVGLAGPGASFARGIEKMTLYVGEVKVLAIKKVDRVAVGNGSLLSTSITENGQLILLAEGQGDTGLHIWHRDGSERDIQLYIQPSNANRSAS